MLIETPNGYLIEKIFGKGELGSTLEEIARNSKALFVRSQDGLAFHSEKATGRILSAWEAYNRFGIEKLEEILEYSSAILARGREEPAFSISEQMQTCGFNNAELSEFSGVSQDEIKRMLDPEERASIHSIEKVARILGLNEDRIVFTPGADRDANLSLRLKKYRTDLSALTLSTLKALLEASWIIQKQNQLKSWLDSSDTCSQFQFNSNYGGIGYPTYMHGYYLAREARRILGLGNRPIASLRELCESKLKIPLIHAELDSQIAGATLSNNGIRGILVNTTGKNKNVWVRRFTIAHELGHLLWDPDQNLKSMNLDEYRTLKELSSLQDDSNDENMKIESRANAFAIEFLAPRSAVEVIYNSEHDKRFVIKKIMETFGLSFFAAKYHLKNTMKLGNDFDPSLEKIEPSDEWRGREDFTNDYFKPQSTAKSKRGRFAFLVAKAFDKNLISAESASLYLDCTEDEIKEHKDDILELYDL